MSANLNPETLLAEYKLSKTNVRIKVLDVFLQNECALSEPELKSLIGENYDRTTIYRTLKTFEKAKVLYKLSADDGLVRYFLDNRRNTSEHNHLHFRCVECNELVCLSDAPISPYKLPDGFTAIKNNFVIVGLCAKCQ